MRNSALFEEFRLSKTSYSGTSQSSKCPPNAVFCCISGTCFFKAESLFRVEFLIYRAFPSDGSRRYVLSILKTSGGSHAQMPWKQGSNHLQTLMSRKCPFSNKTNPHLQIPGFRVYWQHREFGIFPFFHMSVCFEWWNLRCLEPRDSNHGSLAILNR